MCGLYTRWSKWILPMSLRLVSADPRRSLILWQRPLRISLFCTQVVLHWQAILPLSSIVTRNTSLKIAVVSAVLGGMMQAVTVAAADDRPVPVNTSFLVLTGDPADKLVEGVDRFLLRQINAVRDRRVHRWNDAHRANQNWQEFIAARRIRLSQLFGIRDERVVLDALDLVGTTTNPALIAANGRIRIERIRWPVLADPDPQRSHLISVTGEGLLLTPTQPYLATVIAIPDAQQTPERLCGLSDDIPVENQYAWRLADFGFRVIIPAITSRCSGRASLTDREFIYRSSFVLGTHLIGYELQKLLALVDMLDRTCADQSEPIGMMGYGEGGMLALFASALDPRIQCVAVSGYFGPREGCWEEPLDRNVFGLLNDFGAAQLAAMVAPRRLLVEAADVPNFQSTGDRGAPAKLTSPRSAEIQEEVRIAASQGANIQVVTPTPHTFGSTEWLHQFISALTGSDHCPATLPVRLKHTGPPAELHEFTEQRRQRQLDELDRHNQALLRESPFVRKAFMSKLDTASVAAYQESVKSYREIFRNDVIGCFDIELLPPNAQSRKLKETDAWTAYEVSMDVFPDVGAYGILLLPKDLKHGERRPVVVCQHGLEGRPLDTISDDHRAYHDYAAKLCEQGFITFAPQNIYIFRDRFRTLQRKANPLGKTLFSIMVPQHQQIVNWLKSQPFVDGERIAFYGLSYGGKSAMRIPALVTDYCLSICSADFNEWVLKNASTRHKFSYVWHGEYEIFEWNLGRTFNYAEMAALICPRPFMVERGHFDGVGEDEWVAYEYAKIRHLYAARLKIPERTEIEWFDGPHTINGKSTFDFLHRHLDW